MIAGSRLPGGRRIDADRHMLSLHAPEDLGLEAYRDLPTDRGTPVRA
jgi:hypothetical protein